MSAKTFVLIIVAIEFVHLLVWWLVRKRRAAQRR